MSNAVVMPAGLLDRNGKLRQLLELIAALRELAGPITEPDGLRGVIALLMKSGELLGLDPAWIERLRSVTDNEATFQLVLALARFAAGWMGRSGEESADTVRAASETLATVDARSIVEWLPFVLSLVEIWWRLRGDR